MAGQDQDDWNSNQHAMDDQEHLLSCLALCVSHYLLVVTFLSADQLAVLPQSAESTLYKPTSHAYKPVLQGFVRPFSYSHLV